MEVKFLERDRLAQNMFVIIPKVAKKILKRLYFKDLTNSQFSLLRCIKERSMPMSYYSEKMMLPKSNLTIIADKLIEFGFVERYTAPEDRRVVLLKITDLGLNKLKECYEEAKQNVIKKTQPLSDSEIARLNEILEEMNVIFEKIED